VNGTCNNPAAAAAVALLLRGECVVECVMYEYASLLVLALSCLRKKIFESKRRVLVLLFDDILEGRLSRPLRLRSTNRKDSSACCVNRGGNGTGSVKKKSCDAEVSLQLELLLP
jgi:hypothetical protein